MYSLGCADINIKEMTAGSTGSWTISYEVGDYGFDDGGEILIARRDVCDSDIPQFEDPNKPGYVKVIADVEAKIKVTYQPDKYIRPWKSCISVKVYDGYLSKGDRIYIQFGATEGEGCGFRVQTFCEEEHIFKVLVDCAGSGDYYCLDSSPAIRITGGYLEKLEAVAPSTVKMGSSFGIFVRALDSWGNIAEKYSGVIRAEIEGEKKEAEIIDGIGALADCSLKSEGLHYLYLEDINRKIKGRSNPVKCIKEPSDLHLYWGDMHGQTKETVGTGSLDRYFSFGRDIAKLDFCAWQGNDFQVTDETWSNVCDRVKKYNEPGRYVTFLGYEWSGNTPVGGDYNIYFLTDDQKIYRSSHWQIGLNNNDGTDRTILTDLWKQFRGRKDVLAIPHVGGRYGNLGFVDTDFVNVLEIHSHHGTFEWFFEDALKKGLKLGVIGASDDHTCRPGLSYPTRKTSRGFVSFDVMGGFTGVFADSLTREGIWEAIRKRHCFATTGERIILGVRCGKYMMGDEFTVSGYPELELNIAGTDTLSEVEIKRGLETIYSYSETLPSDTRKIRIQWSGVRVKSRNKKTVWDGRLTVVNGRIKGAEKYAFNQPDEGIVLISNQILEWKSSTSGDVDGIELELEYDNTTRIQFSTPPVSFTVEIEELKKGKVVRNAGGINQFVSVDFAKENETREVSINYRDNGIKHGINPYWIKVLQKDGHMAWSSPMFITFVNK